MHEIIWVRDLMGDWDAVLPPSSDMTPFHRIAASVDRTSLLPDAALLEAEWGDWPRTERELVALWQAWRDYIERNDQRAIKRMQEIARSYPDRPEPYVLLASVALLQQKRAPGRKLLERALRVDRNYKPARALLQRFEKRNDPVLRFLDRKHPINIWLGKVRHRWRNR